jgi:hypothetical protein
MTFISTHSAENDEVKRVKTEYVEMPGLRLTRSQAQRLWGLDAKTCDTLLGALVDARFLHRTPEGLFVRAIPMQ